MAVSVKAGEYERMKAFLSFYSDRYFDLASLPPDKTPIACLETLEKMSRKLAVTGLRQAVNDCVERSQRFGHAEVASLDAELSVQGIVTLSELRRRYSRGYAKIMKRGRINNDGEYYLLRNVLDDPTEKAPDERDQLQKLLSAYAGE
jgi:hypothetical protein